MNHPDLVAHRGYMLHYPENTLSGMEAAIRAGARFIEFDVHLTKDNKPVVIHDASLKRTTGIEKLVFDVKADELMQLIANEPERFPGRFSDARIPMLSEMVMMLLRWPEVTAFVELKRRSLGHFGISPMLDSVLECIAPVIDRCVLISFSHEALIQAQVRGFSRIGWVTEQYDDPAREIATRLKPEFLFVDKDELPSEGRLWLGQWKWVVYDVVDPEQALSLAHRGISMIETKAVGEMLAALAEDNHEPF